MLWSFGDSFSVHRSLIDNPPNYNLWLELVCKNLNLNYYESHADWGVSNDWIYNNFDSFTTKFKPGDFIILQLTSFDRQWFFEDKPHYSNYYAKGINEELTKEQYEAVKMYITYLKRDKIDSMRYSLLISALERISQILNHTRILVIPGFNPIHSCKGTLVEVSENEFENKLNMQNFYDKNNGRDLRPNHLSKENHSILADKVTKFFTHGHRLNLTTDFKERFL